MIETHKIEAVPGTCRILSQWNSGMVAAVVLAAAQKDWYLEVETPRQTLPVGRTQWVGAVAGNLFVEDRSLVVVVGSPVAGIASAAAERNHFADGSAVPLLVDSVQSNQRSQSNPVG